MSDGADAMAVEALDSVAKSPAFAQLSPIAQFGVGLYQTGEEIARAIDASDPGATALAIGQSILQAVTPALQAFAGVSAGDILPIVGWAIDLVAFVVGASSSEADPGGSAWEAQRRQLCASNYAPIVSSAPGSFLPCDIFVASNPTTGAIVWNQAPAAGADRAKWLADDHAAKTSVGHALVAITEFDPAIGLPGQGAPTVAISSKLGIPPETRSLFRELRRAIQASHGQGDGGAVPWAVWCDLFNAQFLSGRLTNLYALYCLAATQAGPYVRLDGKKLPGPGNVNHAKLILLLGPLVLAWKKSPGASVESMLSSVPPDLCVRWDPRPLYGALGIRVRWGHFVDPSYEADKKALQATLDGATSALLASTPDTPQNRLLLLALSIAAQKKRKRIRFPKGLGT